MFIFQFYLFNVKLDATTLVQKHKVYVIGTEETLCCERCLEEVLKVQINTSLYYTQYRK